MRKLLLLPILMITCIMPNLYGQGFDEDSAEMRTRPLGEADDPNLTWKIRWDRSDLFKNNNFPDPAFKYDTRRWSKTPEDVQSWVWRNKENIEQKNGSLFITARYNPSGFSERRVSNGCISGSPSSTTAPVRFSSGMLRSTVPGFVYGYYEAAIKGSDGFPGVSPAFWLYNTIKSNPGVGKVQYQEIDIVEMTQEGQSLSTRKIMDHNLHAITTASVKHRFDNTINRPVGGFVPLVANGGLTLGSAADRRWWRPKQNTDALRNETNEFEPRDINVYGCKVTKQEIIWYVNGKEIGRKPNTLWQTDAANPMRITLSLGIRAPYTQFCSNRFVLPPQSELDKAAAFFPQTMEVLYVKVFEADGGTPTQIPVSGVDLKVSEVPIRVGGNTMLTPVITPKNATNKGFTFYSVSGMDVARIDSKTGIVTTLKQGTATFRVITADGNFSDDVTITVGANPGQTKSITIPVPPGSAGLVTSGGGNPTPPDPDPTPPSGSNNCGVNAWVSGTTYFRNDRVSHNNKIWRVRWKRALPRCGAPGSCAAFVFVSNCTTPAPGGGGGTPPPNSGGLDCSSIDVWNKSVTYSIGAKVKRTDNVYELKKSTGKCVPGGSSNCSRNQWELLGNCSTTTKSTDKKASILNSKVKLYPNPATNQINILSPVGAKISIITLNGKQLISKLAQGEITLFDLAKISNGLYLVKIESKGETTINKLVIN